MPVSLFPLSVGNQVQHPGIGGTVFGWYAVYWTLAEQPGRIVLHIARSGVAHIIPPSGAVYAVNGIQASGDYHDDEDPMMGRSARLGWSLRKQTEQFHVTDPAIPLIISDAIMLEGVPCPTLAIVSRACLAQMHSSAVRAYSWRPLHLPLPSEEEVLAMHAAAFGHLPLDGVKLRLQLWGPIPRRVLALPHHGDQVALWKQAAAVPLESLTALASAKYDDISGT